MGCLKEHKICADCYKTTTPSCKACVKANSEYLAKMAKEPMVKEPKMVSPIDEENEEVYLYFFILLIILGILWLN